jgi:hypothetical protein
MFEGSKFVEARPAGGKRGKEIANRKGEGISHESTKVIDVILESSDCAWDEMKQRWKSDRGVLEGVISRNFSALAEPQNKCA